MLVRIDNAKFVAVIGQIVECRTAPLAANLSDGIFLFDFRENLFARQPLESLFGVNIFHILDITDRHTTGFGIFHHIHDLIFVDAFEGHHVDLHFQAHFQSFLHPGKDFSKYIFLCDPFGDLGFECIDGDIDTFESCILQPLSHIGQQIAVGRQSQIDIAFVVVYHPDKPVKIFAKQRFATCYPDLVHPFVNCDTNETEQLLKTEQIFPRNP